MGSLSFIKANRCKRPHSNLLCRRKKKKKYKYERSTQSIRPIGKERFVLAQLVCVPQQLRLLATTADALQRA